MSNELRDAVEGSAETKRSNGSAKAEAPRHDLKIIIAKKPSSKSENNNNKIKLNKLNGSKVLSDSVRLRGDVDNVHFASATSSDFVSTSETKTTLSKKTGTVSHHDLKLENKSNTKKHSGSSNDSHDYFEFTMNDREKEKSYAEKAKQHESTKHAKNNEKVEKFKASHKSNIPKLKIELPSLKTTILVPKTPTDSYFIASKSPGSPSKKVRFDISPKDRCYDFDDDQSDDNLVDQTEYAAKIGLKPVKRTVDSIILHRKRKKSKHSKELPEHTKRPKLHVSSSLDESLKLKLKIMGGKSCKKSSNDEEARETCNFRAVPCKNDSTPKAHEEKQKNIREKQKEASGGDVVGLENHKYSVSEQKNVKSGSDQPMVFIPKLVLQKTKSNATDKKVYTIDTTQRRDSFAVEESKPPVESSGESMKLKVKPFDSIASRDCASPKLMKPPPRAKMGSPQQPHLTNSFSLSPIRPQSIPASLKFAPNSPSPPSSTSDIQHQNLKRSFSLGSEKSPQSYFNMFLQQSNKDSFPSSSTSSQQNNAQKMPPLIPSSTSSLRNFFDAMANKLQSPQQNAAKQPKFSVKDPTKLFLNACPSVEILKIPQKTYSPINSIKLNRPMTSIPLERIRKSAQSPAPAKYLPKPPAHQHMVKPLGFQQSPQCSSQTSNSSGNNSPIIQDISLERYTLELTHDIAKLDRSLSLEKNFEHWERRKLQEYSSKLNDMKNFPMPVKNLLNQQQNLSVRNIPNPSAIIRNRNQTNNDSQKACNMSPQTVTSTNSDADIEEMLSKSTIARATGYKPEQLSSQKSPGSKVNDKKSIEKLTEYLRLTAAKSKDPKHDDDNNNNSYDDSSTNNRGGFKLMENKFEKFMNSVNVPSVDVICIDS